MGPRQPKMTEDQLNMEAEVERARELADTERALAAQQQAADLTTDFRSVYGPRAFSMFSGLR